MVGLSREAKKGLGEMAAMPCPIAVYRNSKRIIWKNTWPEVEPATVSPMVKYQQPK